jgi:carboxymethylenebutenolidase
MESGADIAAVFDAHMAAEFVYRDLDSAMATMTNDPYAYQVPVMTGGVDSKRPRSDGERFIGRWPEDTEMTPVSRTVGENQVADEILSSFRHNIEMDQLLPAVPPTARTVRLRGCVVVRFEGGKVAHEHIYWDHASLLVQVGPLDPAELAVIVAERSRRPAVSASAADEPADGRPPVRSPRRAPVPAVRDEARADRGSWAEALCTPGRREAEGPGSCDGTTSAPPPRSALRPGRAAARASGYARREARAAPRPAGPGRRAATSRG